MRDKILKLIDDFIESEERNSKLLKRDSDKILMDLKYLRKDFLQLED